MLRCHVAVLGELSAKANTRELPVGPMVSVEMELLELLRSPTGGRLARELVVLNAQAL